MRKEIDGVLWRYLTNFWTVVIYVAIIVDFVSNNAYQELLGPIAAIYIASLAIFTGDKEFDRWCHNHERKHPGELFVLAWTIMMSLIIIIDLFLGKPYKMPGEVISTYIAVLTILAITQKSKSTYWLKKS